MHTISITEFSDNLDKIIDFVNATGEHVVITTGNGKNVALMSEVKYKSLVETIYLSSLKGTAKTIADGMKTPPKECLSEAEAGL